MSHAMLFELGRSYSRQTCGLLPIDKMDDIGNVRISIDTDEVLENKCGKGTKQVIQVFGENSLSKSGLSRKSVGVNNSRKMEKITTISNVDNIVTVREEPATAKNAAFINATKEVESILDSPSNAEEKESGTSSVDRHDHSIERDDNQVDVIVDDSHAEASKPCKRKHPSGETMRQASKKVKTVHECVDTIVELIKQLKNKKISMRQHDELKIIDANQNPMNDQKIVNLIEEILLEQQSRTPHPTLPSFNGLNEKGMLSPLVLGSTQTSTSTTSNLSCVKLLGKNFVPRIIDVVVSNNEDFLQDYGNRARNDLFERLVQFIAVPLYIEIIENRLYEQQQDVIKSVIETIHGCGGFFVRPVIISDTVQDVDEVSSDDDSVCIKQELRFVEVSSFMAQLYTLQHLRKQTSIIRDDNSQ